MPSRSRKKRRNSTFPSSARPADVLGTSRFVATEVVVPKLSSSIQTGDHRRTSYKMLRFALKLLSFPAMHFLTGTHVPIFLLVGLGCAWLITGLLVIAALDNDATYYGANVIGECAFFALACFLFPLVALPFSWVYRFLRFEFYATPFYYYATSTLDFFVLGIWTVAMWISSNWLLDGLDHSVYKQLRRCFVLLLVVSITFLVQDFLVKAGLDYSRRKTFWKKINRMLETERVVYIIAFGPLVDEPSEETFASVRPYVAEEDPESDKGPNFDAFYPGLTTHALPQSGFKSEDGHFTPAADQQIKGEDDHADHASVFRVRGCFGVLLVSSILTQLVDKWAKNNVLSGMHFYDNSTKTYFSYQGGTEPDDEAEAIAKKIFDRLGRDYDEPLQNGYVDGKRVGPNDFQKLHAFSKRTKADQAFEIIDEHLPFDDMTLVALRTALKDIFASKKRLKSMLHSEKNIGGVVKALATAVWLFIMFLVAMRLWNVDLETYVLTFGAFFLGLSFVFGSLARDIFENFVFIFFVRAFDTGDRITIEGSSWPAMIISEIGLLNTVAFAPDGRQFLIPNSKLRQQVITQYSRSKDYAVSIDLVVNANTSHEKLKLFKERLYQWMVESKAPWKIELPSQWLFYISLVEDNQKMKASIWVVLRGVNWSKVSEYLAHKSNMYLAIQELCGQLEIEYEIPKLRVVLGEQPYTEQFASSIV